MTTNIADYKFDKVFLGSDIVWDYTVGAFNNDPLLFGKGFNTQEIDAYAASFGTVSVDATLPDYVVNALKDMKHISVRDDKSAELVRRVTGVRPQVVLDPTWLWDFNSDCNIIKPKEEDYILVYGQDFTSEFINNLIEYAREHNKRIIALDCNSDHYTWCDKLISQDQLSPFQWIGYFKYAAEVATSTFSWNHVKFNFRKELLPFVKQTLLWLRSINFFRNLNLFNLFDKKSKRCLWYVRS